MARAVLITIKGFRRQIQTCADAGVVDALAIRLLRESESGIKATLDSEASLALRDGDECFWEPLVVRLGDFSSRKAMLVLEWKLEKLLKEDNRSYEPYSKLIQYSGNLNCISFAMRVFTSIESRGIPPNTSIFNSLLSASLSAGSLSTAWSLFEIMQWSGNAKPDLATFNSFISMYSNLGDDRCMMGWHSAAKRSGFLPSVHTYELLIAGFIRSGKFKEANQLFEEILSSKTSPNSLILCSMLEGFCLQKDTKRIIELAEYMIKRGLKMSLFSVKKLISWHFEQGKVEELVALIDLLKSGIDFSTDTVLHGSVIRAYALLDKVEEMEYWIAQLSNDGIMFVCREDVEAVICSYFRLKAFAKMDLFLDRIRGSYKLGKSTYDILVAGYRKFELYDRLDAIIKEMKVGGHAS